MAIQFGWVRLPVLEIARGIFIAGNARPFMHLRASSSFRVFQSPKIAERSVSLRSFA